MTLSKTLCLKLLGRPKFYKPLYKKIDCVSWTKLSTFVTTQNLNIATSQSYKFAIQQVNSVGFVRQYESRGYKKFWSPWIQQCLSIIIKFDRLRSISFCDITIIYFFHSWRLLDRLILKFWYIIIVIVLHVVWIHSL